jgi:hypothetical protein
MFTDSISRKSLIFEESSGKLAVFPKNYSIISKLLTWRSFILTMDLFKIAYFG